MAGLCFLPGLAGAATVALYIAGWPPKWSGPGVFGLGTAFGAAAWFLGSLILARGLARVETANSAVYSELLVRATSINARVQWLKSRAEEEAAEAHTEKKEKNGKPVTKLASRAAYKIAVSQNAVLRAELGLVEDDHEVKDASLPWLLGYGYVNLWRRVHRVEEALLELEEPPALYVAAIVDEARLRASSVEGRELLADKVKKLVSEDTPTAEPSAGILAWAPGLAKPVTFFARGEKQAKSVLEKLDQSEARVLLRETRYALDRYRNNVWDELVHLRNLLFATMVFTGIVTYALLGLAVFTEVATPHVVAAATFYLIGALVGLFAELYATSRREGGAVNDYGLALVRVLTIPLLSGIAAVGGVLLTRLAAITSGQFPSISDIFSLSDYPSGLIVAAIFGLTPNLLLERLKAQTEQYKKQLEETQAGESKST